MGEVGALAGKDAGDMAQVVGDSRFKCQRIVKVRKNL